MTHPNYEEALTILNDIDGVEAHTHGGGMRNDLTVKMDRLSEIYHDTIEEVEARGFSLFSIDTGNPDEHDFTALLCFEEE